MHIGRIRVKKFSGFLPDFSQTKKNTKYSDQYKIEQIKNNKNLLENILAQVKKERVYLKKD